VILINLLPHREERRKRRKQAFFAGLGAAAAAGLAIAGIWYLVVQQLISVQQGRNAFLAAEIQKLESEIKDVATLRAEIEALKARQRAVEDLQINRNVPVHVLNDLVRHTPEGVYFSSIKQDGQTLSVVGVAQTNERVSELLRNMGRNAEWLERPELQEIKVAAVVPGSPGARENPTRLFDFNVRLTVRRPQDPTAAAAAGAASAPARTTAAAGVPAAAPARP
jgi:type IV pilus assembly protein PilN